MYSTIYFKISYCIICFCITLHHAISYDVILFVGINLVYTVSCCVIDFGYFVLWLLVQWIMYFYNMVLPYHILLYYNICYIVMSCYIKTCHYHIMSYCILTFIQCPYPVISKHITFCHNISGFLVLYCMI